jgi:hypothetical protein
MCIQNVHNYIPSTYHVHAIIFCVSSRWTAAGLKKVIAILLSPEFDSQDIDPDLHEVIAKAVDDGCIRCFNLLVGPAYGYQVLNLWIRELEDVVLELWMILSSNAIKTSIMKWTLMS